MARAFAAVVLGFVIAAALLEAGLAIALSTDDGRQVLSGLGRRGATLAAAASPFSTESYLIHDPFVGWTTRPGRFAFPDQPVYTLLPGGGRLAPRAGADDPVIVAVGDSMTFGLDVADMEAWPARVAQRAGPATVHNLAVPGYGADQVLRTAQRALDRLPRVDVVLIGHAVVSTWRAEQAFSHGPKAPSRLLDDGTPFIDPTPVPTMDAARDHWLGLPRIRHLPTILREAVSARPDDETTKALNAALLGAVVDLAQAHGAVPVLVDLDGLDTFSDDVVEQVCAARRLRCVHTTDALTRLQAGGTTLWTATHHYTAAAHDAVAQEVAAALTAADGPLAR